MSQSLWGTTDAGFVEDRSENQQVANSRLLRNL